MNDEDRKLYPFRLAPLSLDPGETFLAADLGYADSEVANGWLAAATLGELMEMYNDRIVGGRIFEYFGRQFPVCVKRLDVDGMTPLTVCPSDETARQRYDFLGKRKVWYVVEAGPGASVACGFGREVGAEELYMACRHNEVRPLLKEMPVKAGSCLVIEPGMAHAAFGRMTVLEVAESSPLDFRIHNWGRPLELDEFDGSLSLEESLDFICLGKSSAAVCKAGGGAEGCVLAEGYEFTVSRFSASSPLHVLTGESDGFILYVALRGSGSIAVQSGEREEVKLSAGEAVLVPADCTDFIIAPASGDFEFLETRGGNCGA